MVLLPDHAGGGISAWLETAAHTLLQCMALHLSLSPSLTTPVSSLRPQTASFAFAALTRYSLRPHPLPAYLTHTSPSPTIIHTAIATRSFHRILLFASPS